MRHVDRTDRESVRELRGPDRVNNCNHSTAQQAIWDMLIFLFYFLIFWECLLHVSTFATTRVALPTGVKPG
jgi:hypothetical protein